MDPHSDIISSWKTELAMNPLTTLMSSLNSADQATLLAGLGAVADAAAVATAFGIDDVLRNLIRRLRGGGSPVFNPAAEPSPINEILERISWFEDRLLDLEKAVFLPQIQRVAIDRINRVIQNEDMINIVRLAIQEAKLSDKLVVNDAGQERNRFLYLASNSYADSLATLNFAIHDNFLWRSYFGAPDVTTNTHRSIPHVQEIQLGDIIVLAFRQNGLFSILSPLVVTRPVADMASIAGINGVIHTSPFVSVHNPNLNARLADNGQYIPDPMFGQRTGLPVCLMNADLDTELAQNVYNVNWPSPPGNNSIWTMNGTNNQGQYYLPQLLRNWMATL